MEILAGINDVGASVLIKFLKSWNISGAMKHHVVRRYIDGLTEGYNIVFKLEGSEGFLHDRKAIIEAWDKYRSRHSSDMKMQCLATGCKTGVARLHPNIKGVAGAQASGASLVSFNLDAFTSYGKTQSFNAPVSESVAFGYTTALNYLLSKSKNRVRVGDTTVVFWTECSTGGLEEDLMGALLCPNFETNRNKFKDKFREQVARKPQTIKMLHDIVEQVSGGQVVDTGFCDINKHIKFHILGLVPNASRLAVRFWHVDSFGNFLDKIIQHYKDLAIVKRAKLQPDFISVGKILKETASLKDVRRVPPTLGGSIMRSILTGSLYPQSLYSLIISRISSDHQVNYARVATLKAIINRNKRFYNDGNEVVKVALDEQNRNTGYLLGRLFSLLEKAQESSHHGVITTIRDRYFGPASATPGMVFPILLRHVQYNLSKAETDRKIEKLISGIDRFPTYLNLEEQGQFILGYYHQRQSLFSKGLKGENVR